MRKKDAKVVITLTQEEIQKLKMIIFDQDGKEALQFIKTVLKKIDESTNRVLKVAG